ncbi:hypothetical protein PRIPAC_88344, partial [Pristionchus pacificus]|uniref:Uncharacterized protein n=1 Tax=Pristionchus pacificus TaxID=54126 RepID=A0A2A6CWF8_PRIPA
MTNLISRLPENFSASLHTFPRSLVSPTGQTIARIRPLSSSSFLHGIDLMTDFDTPVADLASRFDRPQFVLAAAIEAAAADAAKAAKLTTGMMHARMRAMMQQMRVMSITGINNHYCRIFIVSFHGIVEISIADSVTGERQSPESS